MTLKQTVLTLIGLLAFRELQIPVAFGETPQGTYWRCAANGGINALYCYLRVNDGNCDYSDLVKEQAQIVGSGMHTAATLVQLAAKHGAPLRPVSLTMSELSSCHFPIIVYLDSVNPGDGAFMLLFAMSSDAVDLINGPTCTVAEMTREEFRRVWSGFALIAPKREWGRLLLSISGFAIGCVVVIGFRTARKKGNKV